MIGIFPRKHRRPLFELQLTAMIDIFSMIVIFLVKGTVSGLSDVQVPERLMLPTSISKESVESAPVMTISRDDVTVSITPGLKYQLNWFAERSPENPNIISLKDELKAFIVRMPTVARSSGVLLNVIADREAPYQTVFNSVRVFREAGFETMLFVASGADNPNAKKGAL